MSSEYKIAFVTTNGKTTSQHFGTSRYYEVFTISNGEVTNRELREKPYKPPKYKIHSKLTIGMPGDPQWEGEKEKYLNDEDTNRAGHLNKMEMAEPVNDCDFVVSRGMGFGVFKKFENMGKKPIITDIKHIEDALKAFLDGSIINHTEKMH